MEKKVPAELEFIESLAVGEYLYLKFKNYRDKHLFYCRIANHIRDKRFKTAKLIDIYPNEWCFTRIK